MKLKVTITETLNLTVEAEASDSTEAEQIVSDKWRRGEYVLGADNFAGVEFNAFIINEEKHNITDAAEKDLPLHIQNMLWYILELTKESHEEHHCFNLAVTADNDGRPMQKIIHTHEISVFQNEHSYLDKAPINANVVIRVDGYGKETMMLANELDTRK